MEEEMTTFLPDLSDLENSFTSTASSSYATTFNSSSTSNSARSSLSLSLPSFSSTSSTVPPPHPHRRSDPHWSALRAAANLSPDGNLHLRHLHLLRHLGSGHLARVFHCRLRGLEHPTLDFALKVIDLGAAAAKDPNLAHVRSEGATLAALDHPFLPTLYARLDASHYACFLIDYCSGGDLHALLRRHPGHRLPIRAARFYAAEVLLALEYLHALGFVYRDLKPENVLLRGDGHVMLSDFDLSFQSDVAPSLRRRQTKKPRHQHYSRRRRSLSCLLPHKGSSEDEEEELELVAEPETAFSRACVGTHEYLAPEIISCQGHGSSVDWWAFGVFLYELIYGRTPFKGGTKEATLRNIAACELRFPDSAAASFATNSEAAAARDLITKLVVRDPRKRLGSNGGAAEIKRHPFFAGIRWALIRQSQPPLAEAQKVAAGKRRRWWQRKWAAWRNTGAYGTIKRKRCLK